MTIHHCLESLCEIGQCSGHAVDLDSAPSLELDVNMDLALLNLSNSVHALPTNFHSRAFEAQTQAPLPQVPSAQSAQHQVQHDQAQLMNLPPPLELSLTMGRPDYTYRERDLFDNIFENPFPDFNAGVMLENPIQVYQGFHPEQNGYQTQNFQTAYGVPPTHLAPMQNLTECSNKIVADLDRTIEPHQKDIDVINLVKPHTTDNLKRKVAPGDLAEPQQKIRKTKEDELEEAEEEVQKREINPLKEENEDVGGDLKTNKQPKSPATASASGWKADQHCLAPYRDAVGIPRFRIRLTVKGKRRRIILTKYGKFYYRYWMDDNGHLDFVEVIIVCAHEDCAYPDLENDNAPPGHGEGGFARIAHKADPQTHLPTADGGKWITPNNVWASFKNHYLHHHHYHSSVEPS
ncbi:hypothetical protein T439DRAFT_384558 [Meredithblackwellia eburnea MCA 4105]